MNKKQGILTLIPTPISDSLPLDTHAKQVLLKAIDEGNSIFAVEDLRPGRRNWIRFGLPRECFDELIELNEHTYKETSFDLLELLKKGQNVYIMSDGGLPAFCDPGGHLVSLCHDNNIKVTSTNFENSISLALALSGLPHKRFYFAGFLSNKTEEREVEIKELAKQKETIVLMDTPYRLQKTLADFNCSDFKNHIAFLATELNNPDELLIRGKVSKILENYKENKKEFILILSKNKLAL